MSIVVVLAGPLVEAAPCRGLRAPDVAAASVLPGCCSPVDTITSRGFYGRWELVKPIDNLGAHPLNSLEDLLEDSRVLAPGRHMRDQRR